MAHKLNSKGPTVAISATILIIFALMVTLVVLGVSGAFDRPDESTSIVSYGEQYVGMSFDQFMAEVR